MNETANKTSENIEHIKSTCNDCLKKFNPLQILNRAKAILFSPKTAWSEIKQENLTVKEIYVQYLIPLMLISCLASFIGMQVFGISVPFLGTVRPPFFASFVQMILHIVLGLGGMAVGALIISKIAPKFEGSSNFNDSFQLYAFAYVPALLVGVIGIVPALSILLLPVGLYCMYIYFLGTEPMLGVSEDKKIVFTVLSLVSIAIVVIIITIIVGSLASTHTPELTTQQTMEQLNPMLEKFADTVGKAAQQQ